MRTLLLQGLSSVAFAATFLGASAMALPFQPNGAAFQQYLNTSVNWGAGKKILFSHISNCLTSGMFDYGSDSIYYCYSGYAKVVDPVGTRTCELTEAKYVRGNISYTCR